MPRPQKRIGWIQHPGLNNDQAHIRPRQRMTDRVDSARPGWRDVGDRAASAACRTNGREPMARICFMPTSLFACDFRRQFILPGQDDGPHVARFGFKKVHVGRDGPPPGSEVRSARNAARRIC